MGDREQGVAFLERQCALIDGIRGVYRAAGVVDPDSADILAHLAFMVGGLALEFPDPDAVLAKFEAAARDARRMLASEAARLGVDGPGHWPAAGRVM